MTAALARGGEAGVRVALTFDAEHPSRPHCQPGNEELLLHSLAEAGARATFFLQGRWATAYPNLARAIADGGHLVGNHSHYHASFPLLTPDGWRADLTQAHEAIARTTGEVEEAVVEGTLAHGDGAIVLLHAWPAKTALALPRILGRLQAARARLVTRTTCSRPKRANRTDQTPEP